MPYIGKQPTVGNFQVCDAISVVNGQAAYTMQVGGSNVEPENANHMLVSLNGILQKPGSSFTISGSTITFASNLATGDVIDFITLLGDTLNTGAPSDDTVTAAKLNNDVISGQTALTSSPDDTDELLISDAGTIKRIDVSLVGGKNTPAFLAYRSGSTQSISNATATKIQLNSELFDTDNAFDNSTNYRFTPQTAGKYFFFATSRFDTDTDFQNLELQVHKNGSQYSDVVWRNEYYESATVTGVAVMNGSSDYLELFIYQNSGSSRDIGYDSGNRFLTKLSAYKIIE